MTGRPWLAGSLLSLGTGVGCFVAEMVTTEAVVTARQRDCAPGHHAMPGYVLPLGSVSTALLAVAVALSVVAYRRPPGGRVDAWQAAVVVIAVVAALGCLFVGYLGVFAVIGEIPDRPHCFG